MALYYAVLPIHMLFSEDAEETFSRTIKHLMVGSKLLMLALWFCSIFNLKK